MNRRHFMGLVGGAALAASDQVNVAIIGIHGRGKKHVENFSALAGVNLAWLVDVDSRLLEPLASKVEKSSGKRPHTTQDMRKALDDKSVDAVIIATPDHWHAPATILASNAGKDVYVEKPVSHNIRESRLMIEAARRNKRIVQAGTQSRSRPSTIRAIEYVQSGKIGKVLMAKAWNVQRRKDIGHVPDSPAPREVDYDTWIGPAPALPFNENRFHYNWHWNWNYGTGDAGNDGAHQLDQARWALGCDYPVEVSGMARKLYFQDDQQTPDTMTIMYSYPNGKLMMFEMRIWNPYAMDDLENGVAVYGSEGMVHIGEFGKSWGFKVFDRKGELVLSDDKDGRGDNHAQNFIDCVRSRKTPNADIEVGHISAVHSHLGNIVARTGHTLKFDAKTETIAGDAAANQYVRRQYRPHWGTPKGV